jgi:hypothetical protein
LRDGQDLRAREISLRIGRAENPSLVLNGAGEGIRTPDRLITNQLLYRTELRQPRQKSINSTRRATRASARPTTRNPRTRYLKMDEI